MEVFEAIKKRRSIRRFDTSKKIPDEQIQKLLEAARWAPSAGNLQSWFFFIISDLKTKIKLTVAAYGQIWIIQAPIVIVACADIKRCAARYGKRGENLYAIQDTTIACQNIWLTATGMGLGAVLVGAFNEKIVSRILKLESNLRPIIIMPIGYPAKKPKLPSRRPLKEISKLI